MPQITDYPAGFREKTDFLSAAALHRAEDVEQARLFYRGVSIEDLIQSCIREDRFGFEETGDLLPAMEE